MMNLLYCSISAASAMAVVTSESIDSWGKLGAVGVLGLLCVGFGYMHFKTIKELADAHRESSGVIAAELHDQHEATNLLLSKLIDSRG